MSQVARLQYEHVEAGQKVGEVGSTGHSTGPHLHLSLQVRNKRGVFAWVDPMAYMQPPTPV
jgi:murein DD-endopeptidase MepM/ murein hydrolase activator NlpD